MGTLSGGEGMGDWGYREFSQQPEEDTGWARTCLAMSLIILALALILVVIGVVLVVVVGLLL
jgi:hypothetical protein